MFRCGRQAHSCREGAQFTVARESCMGANRKLAKALSPSHSPRPGLSKAVVHRSTNMDWAVQPQFGSGCHVIGGQSRCRSHSIFKKNCVVKKKQKTFKIFLVFRKEENVLYYCQMCVVVHTDLIEWVGKAAGK